MKSILKETLIYLLGGLLFAGVMIGLLFFGPEPDTGPASAEALSTQVSSQ